MSLLSRTDEQRLAGAPFTISIGGQSLELRPLPRRKSEQWGRALAEAPIGLAGLTLNFTDAEGKLSFDAVKDTLVIFAATVPGVLADLAFAYIHLADPSRSRDWFDDNAADEEIFESLLRMLEITFPFYLRKGQGSAASLAKWLLSESGISLKLPSTSGGLDGVPSKSGQTNASGS